MYFITRNSHTRTLQHSERYIGSKEDINYTLNAYPPLWDKAVRVTGYHPWWNWEIPTEDTLWVYGMTDKEVKKFKN